MNPQDENQSLKNALKGDIHAFQEPFSQFQDQLKSYLYALRLALVKNIDPLRSPGHEL